MNKKRVTYNQRLPQKQQKVHKMSNIGFFFGEITCFFL